LQLNDFAILTLLSVDLLSNIIILAEGKYFL